ncbi:hypothetical protein AAG747_15350 [Rapidithrix thailandica]|uniref:Uncharacterized protein n=1 Tax=Rapidithrix thailandica TaxID=413964 RepID=A0AAW9RWU4_9BACT
MTKEEFIKSRFDIEELINIGFLNKSMNLDEIETRICTYFGLESIFMYDFIMSDLKKPIKADINTFSKN